MGSEKSPMNGHESPFNGDRDPGYIPTGDVNAREIEADIDRTRRHMDETLDKLGERLSPHHMVDDVLEFMKAKGRSINSENVSKLAMKGGKRLGHFVKEHPGPALMAGAGLFWYFLEWSRQGDPLPGSSRIEPVGGIEIDEESAVIYDPYDELSVGVSERRVYSMDEAEVGGVELRFDEDRPGMASRLKDKASHAAEKVGEMGSRLVHGVDDTAQRTGDKLSDLGHRVSDGAHRAADRAGELKERTMGSLREGAHLVSEKARRAGEKMEHLGSKVGHSIKTTADSGVHMVSCTASKVKRGASRTGHQIVDGSTRLAHRIEHGVEDLVHEGDRKARQAFDESPLGVGLALAGLGLLVGALLPSTRVEDQAIGRKSEDLKENMRIRGEGIKTRGEEAIRRVAGAAKSQALKAGLTPTHVLETIQHVVTDIKDAAVDAFGEAIVDIQEAASQALEDESLDPTTVKKNAKSVMDAAKDAVCSKSHEHGAECTHGVAGSIDEDWEKHF